MLRETGNQWLMAFALNSLADLARAQGDYPQAHTYGQESLALWRALDSPEGIVDTLLILGAVARQEGSYDRAAAYYQESLERAQRWGEQGHIARSLDSLVMLATVAGVLDDGALKAARLGGAVEAFRTAHAVPRSPDDQRAFDHAIAAARTSAGDALFAAAWEEGRAMTLEQTISGALDWLTSDKDSARC